MFLSIKSSFWRNQKPDNKIIDKIDPSRDFDYLRPKGKLVYKIDCLNDVPKIDILFKG